MGGASQVGREGSQVVVAQSAPAFHLVHNRQPQHERTNSERLCTSPLYPSWEVNMTKLVTALEECHANL
jgi:hypothetical protein